MGEGGWEGCLEGRLKAATEIIPWNRPQIQATIVVVLGLGPHNGEACRGVVRTEEV